MQVAQGSENGFPADKGECRRDQQEASFMHGQTAFGAARYPAHLIGAALFNPH